MNASTQRATVRIMEYGRKHHLSAPAIEELGELAGSVAADMLSEIIAQIGQKGVSRELGRTQP